MDENLIGEIKNGNIHISISEFKDKKYLDIRKYFTNNEGEFAPTRKGISLTSEQYAELLTLLNENKQTITEKLK